MSTTHDKPRDWFKDAVAIMQEHQPTTIRDFPPLVSPDGRHEMVVDRRPAHVRDEDGNVHEDPERCWERARCLCGRYRTAWTAVYGRACALYRREHGLMFEVPTFLESLGLLDEDLGWSVPDEDIPF